MLNLHPFARDPRAHQLSVLLLEVLPESEQTKYQQHLSTPKRPQRKERVHPAVVSKDGGIAASVVLLHAPRERVSRSPGCGLLARRDRGMPDAAAGQAAQKTLPACPRRGEQRPADTLRLLCCSSLAMSVFSLADLGRCTGSGPGQLPHLSDESESCLPQTRT